MPAVKEVDYHEFLTDSKQTIDQIDKDRGNISARIREMKNIKSFRKVFQQSKLWWYGVSEKINMIFECESGFLSSQEAWVVEQYEDNTLTPEILEMCHEILSTTDREAQRAKDVLRGAPAKYSPSLKCGRPQLRDVVRSHWELHDEIKKNHSLPEDIREGHDLLSLRRALESLKWIWGVVVCYARDDSEDLNKLIDILKPRFESNHIDIFYDDYIKTGADWQKKLNHEFSIRDLALVLVSQLTLDSEFIQKEEVGLLRKRRLADNMGVVIYPIILDECNWQEYDWLKTTQFLPSDNKTIRQHYNSEDAFSELGKRIADEIHDIMKMLSDREQVPEFLARYEGRP